jgi:hypothetical protein
MHLYKGAFSDLAIVVFEFNAPIKSRPGTAANDGLTAKLVEPPLLKVGLTAVMAMTIVNTFTWGCI